MASIRNRLLVWLLSAITLAALAEDVWTYEQAKVQLNEVFDDRLREVAAAVADRPGSGSAAQDAGSPLEPSALLIQAWDRQGDLVSDSKPALGMPRTVNVGWYTVPWRNERWRFFGMHTADGGTVRVGETLAVRRQNSARMARQIDMPLALTSIPALALLIWVAVGRNLRPLTTLANSLVRRKPGALDPLSVDHQPQEIQPIVGALNELLQRVSRALDSERQFIADAAHELQTPLTAVRLQLQVFERATTEDAKALTLKRLDLGTQRAIHVVGQLLTMARLDRDVSQLPLVPVTLDTLIVEVLGEYAVIAQARGIDLGTSVLQPAQILGDRDGLRALLGNLIDNAIHYSPDNGEIDVNLRRDDTWTTLEIIDGGPGIPTQERERVLQRFYRNAASTIPGSGLGLAIVKRIADQHQAELLLGDNPTGPGLRVEVRFHSHRQASAGSG